VVAGFFAVVVDFWVVVDFCVVPVCANASDAASRIVVPSGTNAFVMSASPMKLTIFLRVDR
jgi:hypothetical protein